MPNGVIARVSLLVWIVLLLATALAAVIAMATLHDTVGFALAGGALVATVVATLLVVRAELTQEEPWWPSECLRLPPSSCQAIRPRRRLRLTARARLSRPSVST
jgi:hypothetical protein